MAATISKHWLRTDQILRWRDIKLPGDICFYDSPPKNDIEMHKGNLILRGHHTNLVTGISNVRAGDILCLVAEGQVSQLVALVKNVIADSDVYQGREDDAGPNGYIIAKDTERIVGVRNPAPQLARGG